MNVALSYHLGLQIYELLCLVSLKRARVSKFMEFLRINVEVCFVNPTNRPTFVLVSRR